MEFITLFLIGLTATTIGTMAGGGGMISLPAMLLLGIPVHSAIGANKVSNTVSSLSSFLVVYRKKQVTLKEAFLILPFSLTGGVLGGLLAVSFTEETMKLVAVILLAFAFAVSFIGKQDFSGGKMFSLRGKGAGGLLGAGVYDGMFGPGNGTLLMMLFGKLNLSYMRSVGLTRIAVFSSCIGAAATYIAAGAIIWPLTAALLLGSLSGAQVGVRLAGKLKPQYVKPMLRLVTVLLILQITWQR
ncbi:sulfite exporter TauE/SafE family protein [Indiicoccus explosivorum]|uniref:sulfite exporter TauE/SafE family protein n=1 Tax=Indiicoccus explosivorum TaxID=1917864 RepID=UPI000B450C5F|nr:sulfite exporter TauE/SafE family protein [Indiicoccus explosivorum]